MNPERLLERFLQYVKIDTTAVEESGRYPSSDGQFELGKLLVAQLEEMGAADVQVNQHGIVMATVSGNVDGAHVLSLIHI